MHYSVVFLVFNLLAFKELLKSVVWDLLLAFEDSRRQRLYHLVSSSSLKLWLCPDWWALHVSWASFVVLLSSPSPAWFSLSLGSWYQVWNHLAMASGLVCGDDLAYINSYRKTGPPVVLVFWAGTRKCFIYNVLDKEREWASWAQTFLILGFLVTDVLCLAALSFRHCDFLPQWTATETEAK